MRQAKDFILERVKQLREQIWWDDTIPTDERNRRVDQLDELQETIAYRDIPRV